MPSALPEIAVFMYWTICGTLEVVEPPHLGTGMPSSAAASWKPYWVGTKNGFVVTWFTNQNCHLGVAGKFPAVSAAALLLLPPDEEQAASSAVAAALALTSPVPFSRRRRVGPSFMLRVWIASSTLGSILSMFSPPDGVLGARRCPPLPCQAVGRATLAASSRILRPAAPALRRVPFWLAVPGWHRRPGGH